MASSRPSSDVQHLALNTERRDGAREASCCAVLRARETADEPAGGNARRPGGAQDRLMPPGAKLTLSDRRDGGTFPMMENTAYDPT